MIKYISKILLLFCAFIPLISLMGSPITLQLRQYALSVCFILLAAFLWRNKILRLVSIVLLILWILNLSTSLMIWMLFESRINTELAMTLLSTNWHEALDFLLGYWQVTVFGVIFFIFMIWLTARLSKDVSPKVLKIASCLLIAVVSYKFAESAFRGRLFEPSFSMAEKVLPYTSLDNAGVFSRAIKEIALLDIVKEYTPVYDIDKIDKGIDTYVIIIGESVRRNNVSLYGYPRQTTPNIDGQKDNLYIFEHAIAPAPITTMSIASTLSIKAADSNEIRLLSDNIINLANEADFETYWYSRQGAIGQHETMVTLIAQNAKHKQWLGGDYDDALLLWLDKALSEPTMAKKLIVLHTNGSHLSACNQYPASDQYFTDGASDYEDCYDNSIRYMDKLVGAVIERLKNQNASVLYFSDHGQHRRIKRSGDIDYIHGAINPYKEAVDVPQFIWFSPRLANNNRLVGTLATPFSLEDNYYLISDWLGIEQKNIGHEHSPLHSDYHPRDKIRVMDTHLTVFDYDKLTSETAK